MALYNGSEKVSSQINTAQYADVTDLMKHMTIEVGDVGQVMLPLNENENKRRYLNGQIILQEQFKKFTEKLKKAVLLYPTLVCTETEWQALRKADPDDQCAKFVVDNVNGTIRLPRVKYLVGNLNLYRFAEGLPNRRLVKIYKSGNNWYNWYSDGWIEQGGYFGATGSDASTTVKLLMKMENNRYNLQVNMQWTGDGAANYQYLNGHNLTQTTFETTCQSSTYHNWMVTGYTATKPDTQQQYSNTLKSAFESPYYIQVSTGVDYEVDITNKITNNNPYAFGMIQRSNARLNNVSWLESNGEFHSGTTYAEYYEWLLKNYNTPTDDIVVKLNTDSGITEYDYVINTADRTFKLPTLIGDENVQSTEFIDLSNQMWLVASTAYSYTAPYNGFFYGRQRATAASQYIGCYNDVTYDNLEIWSGAAGMLCMGPLFMKRGQTMTDIRSNFVGADKVVRFHKAISGYKHLYFYVGEAEQNLDLINVGNMAENFATVSSKLDEISTASEYISTVETQVNEMSTVVNTFDTKMASVDEHVAELTTTVEGMADIQTQMGTLSAQMDEVTVKMEEVNTVANNISNFTQRYLVEAWQENNNWYNLYSDGWLEQGGYYSGSVDGWTTQNFFKSYTTKPIVNVHRYSDSTSDDSATADRRHIMARGITSTGFNAWGIWAGYSFLWEAKGYTTPPVTNNNENNNEGVLNPDDLEDMFG